jgi:ribosomal-protein-alanine N-acetyltransferase
MPEACALVIDHCFQTLALHRLEINIRPENAPSLRVVQKLGFRDEGVRKGFLHIDGAWRDHRTFALNREELTSSMLERICE